MTANKLQSYSALAETRRIVKSLCDQLPSTSLPSAVKGLVSEVTFTSARDFPCFPIPFKETETTAALKAIEASVVCLLADLKDGESKTRPVVVNLEKTTAFLCQAYLATVDGLGKLDPLVKKKLKDTDLMQAQSDRYRRMSANLYETKTPGEYYHIHGSLEANTTLGMIGLESYRPDLKTHEAIVDVIEGAVKKFSVQELEELNAKNRQAGIPALKHEEFLQTPHGKTNFDLPLWSVDNLENETPNIPLPASTPGEPVRPLAGIKVLELCRIIAGPVITRILGEYGADVLKITSPNLSDVPFFQVDGNMGKHAADLDLKTPEGRKVFEGLLAEADVLVDGYRPGALERLGYGATALTKLAKERGKGFVYVNENCFGYQGEWAGRAGWQQIADCASGVAWEQGKFMGLNEPLVPPFPLSDYGTGCIGAIAALTGLYHRATKGGSWHGKASLIQYDIQLFKSGLYPEEVQEQLRKDIGDEFLALRHGHSVDQISGTALRRLRQTRPEIFCDPNLLDTWYSAAYKADVQAVLPVAQIDGLDIGFRRASRPNGTDEPTWDFHGDGDYRR
ncbi:CoA-transferase family III domain-containing protein [Mariannaea sp. PMI_226]|nr:CoA-transferase family III domain-containing protein [Mariannaea sp. PMI_226]